MHYTRKIDLREFLELIVIPFLIGIAILVIISVGGAVVIFDKQTQGMREQNFYWALQGRQVNDTEIEKLAQVAHQIYNEQFQNWSETIDMDLKYIFERWDNVTTILENPETEVRIETPSWDDWFLLVGFISWVILAFALSIGYPITTSNENYWSSEESNRWWQYPWRRWWAYPMLLLMMPYVIFTQPAVAIYAIIRKIRGLDRREKEEELEATLKERNRSWWNPKAEIEANKAKFESLVSLIKKDYRKSRQKWIESRKIDKIIQEKEQTKSEIQQLRAKLSSLGTEIETLQRNLALAENRRKTLEIAFKKREIDKKTKEELEMEFDRLLKIPLVKAVKVQKREIKVFTDTIYITYKGRKYEIGNFLIRIGTTGEGYIKIINLCNTSNCGRHHPYSSNRGEDTICFGNLTGSIDQLLVERDYLSLIIVILQALQTARGDNPQRVKQWKRVRT